MALALRAWHKGGSWSLNKEMKNGMKEKGVIERILHFRAPKINASILAIVCVSNIMPTSLYFTKNKNPTNYKNVKFH